MLVKLGYLVPVEKKPYDYIFYADANGLLWERDKETMRILNERAKYHSEKSYAEFQQWLAKVKAKEEQKQLEQQNNGAQSDENKKADEE